jgi:hypothetical protein
MNAVAVLREHNALMLRGLERGLTGADRRRMRRLGRRVNRTDVWVLRQFGADARTTSPAPR